MTTETLTTRKVFKNALSYFCTIWILGWKLTLKGILAAVILSILSIPINFLSSFITHSPYFSERSTESISVLVGIGVFAAMFYLPLAVYVAGSWVGFCKRVDPDEEVEGI